MKPGIHEGIEFDKYLDIDALSFSDLENWLAGTHKSLGRRGTLGSLAHCLVLEGAEAVKARYVKLESNADLRLKANRHAMIALAEETGNRFLRGVMLYQGHETVPFGKNLHAVPMDAIWQS